MDNHETQTTLGTGYSTETKQNTKTRNQTRPAIID